MDPKFILTNDDTNDTTDSSISPTSTNNSKKKRGVNRKYYFSSDHESFIEANLSLMRSIKEDRWFLLRKLIE